MKFYSILFLVALVIAGCTKTNDTNPVTIASEVEPGTAKDGGGGGGNNSGFIQSVLSGNASRLISTYRDSILVSFTQAAPPEGWTLILTSSDPAAVQVPSTYPVPPGAFVVYPPVTAGTVINAKNVTISVKLFSQTKTTVLKVFPLTATFPAPLLQSPGNGANINFRILVTFDWNDNNNAYYSQLQISIDNAFTNLITDVLLNESIWAQSYFNGTGTRYWRVRFVDASGNAGPWSQVRSFVERPQ